MTANRTPLEVGDFSLSIGEHSVGLAVSRTAEHLIEAYLELITLVRDERPDALREDDVETLVNETFLDAAFIRNRVNAHLLAASS